MPIDEVQITLPAVNRRQIKTRGEDDVFACEGAEGGGGAGALFGDAGCDG
jgi:hypothetical protein